MDPLSLASDHILALVGMALILLGIAIRWRTSRYDLRDAVIDSAWQTARGRRSAETPTEVEKRFNEITSQSGAAGKVTAAASTVVGHFFAQAMAVVALLMLLAGAALIAADLWWR